MMTGYCTTIIPVALVGAQEHPATKGIVTIDQRYWQRMSRRTYRKNIRVIPMESY